MSNMLQDLLPPDLKLLLNVETRTLSLLCISSSSILVQKQLTRNEWSLFTVLVTNHPHYAPYEVLLASLTSLSPDACRVQLHKAQREGAVALTQELKPVYRALSSLRIKLKAIYPPLKIYHIRDTGYGFAVAPS